MTGIEGSVAIVTGASKGLGREIARQLAAEGVRVIATARSEPLLASLVDEIHSSGGRAAFRAADLRDPGQCATLVDWTVQETGRLDILVNNAGIGYWGPVEKTTDEQWRQTMALNVDAVFYTSRAAIAPMKAARHGIIVNLASVLGSRGAPNMAAYCASKAAVISFSDALAKELKEYGIRVAVVAPGTADTEFRSGHSGRPIDRGLTDPARMLTPADVASTVLLAVKASPHVAALQLYLDPLGA